MSVYARPQPHDIEACAKRLFDVIERLRAASDLFTFSFAPDGPLAGRPCSSRKVCWEGLEEGAFAANLGSRDDLVRGFRLRLAAAQKGVGRAELAIVTGIDRELTPFWKTNQIALEVIAHPLAGPVAIATLTALARGFEADWGMVGGEEVPQLPPIGPGTPAAGWMTFLSTRHGDLPLLASPAAVVPIDGGAIVVAQPEPFDERRPRDLANVQAVRDALGPRVLQRPPLPPPRAEDADDEGPVTHAAPPRDIEVPRPLAPPIPPPAAPLRVPTPVPGHALEARASSPGFGWSSPQAPAPAPPPSGPTLRQTVDGRTSPFAAGAARPSVPFVSADGRRDLPPQSPRASPSRSGDTAVALDTAPGQELPFAGGPAPTPELARRTVSLAVYAAVCAEVRLFPERADAVFKRYGLGDPAMRAAVNAAYVHDLGHDAELRARFDELVSRAQSTMR